MTIRALCAIATLALATLGLGAAPARAELAIDIQTDLDTRDVVGGLSIRF